MNFRIRLSIFVKKLAGILTDCIESICQCGSEWVSEWVKSLSHVQLFATPWTVAHQAPPSMEFSRQAYWSGLQCGSIAILIRKSVLIHENRMNLSVYLVLFSYLSTTFYSSQSKSFAILLLSFIPKFFFQCYYKWNCFLNLVFFDTTDTKNYNFFGSLILYKNTIDFVYWSCILEHCQSSNSFFPVDSLWFLICKIISSAKKYF